MLIDLILDRKDGVPYNAKDFYTELCEYLSVFPFYGPIASAMDCGRNEDVVNEMCSYIDEQGYSPHIKDYVRSVEWV